MMICCALLILALGEEIVAPTEHTKVPGDSNKLFKEAVKGWDVVKEYTDPSLAMATVSGAIFSVWHNISGAILASVYKKQII